MKNIFLILIILFAITGCKKKESDLIVLTPADSTPKSDTVIGGKILGGVIFYIDSTGQHGLIAAPPTKDTYKPRWNNGTFISINTSAEVGTGQANTTAIVAAQGDGVYAASYCDQLVIGDYEDWYLPSGEELLLLWKKKDIVGDIYPDVYWSSTSLSPGNIDVVSFTPYGPGGIAVTGSGQNKHVRAIRSF